MPVDTVNREYRSMTAVMEAAPQAGEYVVRGYATTYDYPYLLWERGGDKIYEQVRTGAIDADTDLSDVIMQFDHAGRVFARTSNGSLRLTPTDAHGLLIEADLGATENSRSLYEDIKAGLITRMSWGFHVDDESWEDDERARKSTRTIGHVSKVFDVSAVSRPANDATEISARSCFDGAIEAARAERARRSRELAAAVAKLRLNR